MNALSPNDRIGVLAQPFNEERLKIAALLFDKLLLVPNGTAKTSVTLFVPAEVRPRLGWLAEHGVLIDDETANAMHLLRPTDPEALAILANASVRLVFGIASSLIGPALFGPTPSIEAAGAAIVQGIGDISTSSSRAFALHARNAAGLNAVAFSPVFRRPNAPAAAENVLRVVIDSLPVIDDSTPWEAILELRADCNAQAAYSGLVHWMNNAAVSDRSESQIADELRSLLDAYNQHMRVHKVATHRGVLESFVVGSAELFENFLKINWGRLATTLFSVSKQNVELMKAELAAPGRQVAYIAHIDEALRPRATAIVKP